jgi:hypothetical protein
VRTDALLGSIAVAYLFDKQNAAGNRPLARADPNPVKFHARLIYPGREVEIALNLSREQLIAHVAIPFIAGQVVELPFHNGTQLINMRAVVRVILHQTEQAVEEIQFYNPHTEPVKDCTEEILREARKHIASPGIRSLIERQFAITKRQAFIIMQIGDKQLDSAYEGAVKPLFEEFGITPLRMDEVEDSGRINEQMLTAIAESTVVFADLSGERPNCYYETGFAHALGKDLILTKRSADKLHFDLSAHRIILWDVESELRSKLRNRLVAMFTSPPDEDPSSP